MLFFTIATASYLPRAAALGQSLAVHHPGCRLAVVLVDRVAGRFDPSQWPSLDIVEVESLGIADLQGMMARYDVVEFATAVKPFAMQHLFERSPEKRVVAYLDPDVFVYHPLDSIGRELDGGSVLLTPHFLVPFRDGRKPTENAALRYGVFNLGFIAAARGDETSALLAWWSDRVREQCFRFGHPGIYTDQLWMNLAPVYFPGTKVWRDPGANAAWWNLQERRIERDAGGGSWKCNGGPLLFYHFSKLRPEGDDRIAGLLDRYTFTTLPALGPLYSEYRSVLEAQGQAELGALRCLLPLRADPPRRTFIGRVLDRIAG